jgi:hypothetical protein
MIIDTLTLYNDIATYTRYDELLYAEENSSLIDDTDILSAESQDDYPQPVCFADRIKDFSKIDRR